MVTLTPQGFFAILAGIVALAFILDYFFRRTRLTSVLPLMLLGLLLVQTGVINQARVNDLVTVSGFVSAFAIAMILLLVGLEIDLQGIAKVFRRAMAWTLLCQVSTGLAISLLFVFTVGWPPLWCFVFGFAVSGPSGIVIQSLLRPLVMKSELRSTIHIETVITDVVQLVVPTTLIQVYLKGTGSGLLISSSVALEVLGSIALGVGAGLLWVYALDRGRAVAKGYTWVLTVTIALGLFSITVYTSLIGSLVIFLFGAVVGNAALLDYRRNSAPLPSEGDAAAPRPVSRRERVLTYVRGYLKISPEAVDAKEIAKVQGQVTYIIGAFFFFYIGILFFAPAPTFVYILPVIAVGLALLIRFALLPILSPFLDANPTQRNEQSGLIACTLPRGLSAAVVAILVISTAGVAAQVPGFLDAVFVVIVLSNVVATLGVLFFYRERSGVARLAEETPAPPSVTY